jgi:spermidine synthase
VKVAVFLAGAALMALEVSAFRIVGRVFGTALRETTTVIAVFMAAMSIGYWGGGRIGDRWPSGRTLATALLGASIGTAIVPWLDRIVSLRISESGTAISLHALIASLSLFFLPTLLLSAVSPIAIRLVATQTAHSGSTAGSISALSTIGSIAGTIATAFVLLDWLQSINRMVLVVAVTLFLTTLIVLAGEAERGRRSVVFTTIVAALALAAYAGTANLNAPHEALQNVLFERDSPYHHILVREHGRGRFRILQFDLKAVQSSMLVRDPSGPGLAYADDLHLAKVIRPEAKSLLIIGLGGGTAVKQFLRLYPDVTIDAVDIDPMVVEVARKFFMLPESNRLRVTVSDGRVFLKGTTKSWDVIFVDSYTHNRYGSTIPPHLVTREFFAEAKRHLNPSGIVHFHCATSLEAPMAQAVYRTLRDVFPTVIAIPETGYTELFATTALEPISREMLIERTRPLPWADLRGRAAAMTDRPPLPSAPLLTDDYAPVDTLLRGK